nr:hypothetical protein [uncultured Acetatifactor sp.]
MKSLIVLCAGGRLINGLPIFLNRHPDGKLLAEKAIEGILAESYNRIYFTILKEANEKFRAGEVLLNELGKKHPVEIIMLDSPTSGPAESVYETIKTADIDGEFAARDSLNGIRLTNETFGNYVAGLDLTKYDSDVFHVQSKSFIVVNEQHQILDVIEKRFRSDVISVGLYGFKNVSDYMLAYEKLSDSDYPIRKLYLSNIISYLIGYKQKVFHCADVSFHEDWGTTETWSKLQKKYATVFIDADKLIGKQLTDDLFIELLGKLMVLSDKALTIVLFTRSYRVNKKALCEMLDKRHIRCIDVVCGVSYSNQQIIVSEERQIELVALGV